MKKYIFFLILSFFTVFGCTFLRGGEDDDAGYEGEESFEDSEWGEEGEDYEEGEEYEEEGEDIVESEEQDEEFDSEEDEGEIDEEAALEEGKKEKKGGWRGFFSRLFGSSDDSEEELEEDGETYMEKMEILLKMTVILKTMKKRIMQIMKKRV